MSKLFYTGINLQQNQILNAVLHNAATAPLSPVEGQQYWNTTDNKGYIYNGTAWEELRGSTLTVAPDSQSFVTITNDQLSIKNLAITTVTVDTTSTDLATFIAANYTVGTEFQEGDMIILTAATNQSERSWIHNGGTAVSASDFTRLQTDLNASDVRALFAGGDGVTYDNTTGTFSTNVDNTTLEIVADNLQVKDGGITQAKLDTTLEGKIVNAYKTLIGDGTNTSFNVTHSLGSEDIFCSAWKVNTKEHVECMITIVDANTVSFGVFPAPSANNIKVLIQKAILS